MIFLSTSYSRVLVASLSEKGVWMQLLVDAVESCGGIYMITADHGNCDDMAQRKKNGEPLLDNTGKVAPLTSHTLAPVLILYHPSS